MSFAISTALGATFVGSIAGDTLTVSSGNCQPGFILSGVGVTTCTVAIQLTGTQNGIGTYRVTVSQTVAAGTSFTGTIRIITQTGTDTSLAGLYGLTGVTTAVGVLSSHYTLDSTRLSINGTLTCSPLYERVFFTNSPFQELTVGLSTAVLNIAGSYTGGGGATEYTTNAIFTFSRNCAGYNGSTNAQFYSIGTVNWVGGMIQGDGLFYAPSGTINVNNAYAVWAGQTVNGVYFTNLVYAGPFTVIGKRAAPQISGQTWTDFSPQNATTGLDGGPTNSYLNLVNFRPRNLTVDVWARNSNGRIIKGCTLGAALKFQNPVATSVDAQWRGLQILTRDVRHRAYEPSGTAIANFKVFWQPIDDGKRVNLSAFGPALAAFDFTSAPAQSWTTTALGVSETIAVKIKGWWVTNLITPAYGASSTVFTLYGDDTATVVFAGCSYLHLLASNKVSLNDQGGIDTFDDVFTVPVDTTITQVTMATVAAYTLLNATAAQLYDYAKYYLWLNFQTTGLTALYCTRADATLNFGAYNLVLNPNAAQEFLPVGNTITLKIATFTGSLTTTGTITLLNGATISGTYTDSTGAHATLTFTGLPEGTEVRLRQGSFTLNQVQDVAGGTYSYAYTWTADRRVRAQFTLSGYEFIDLDVTLGSSNQSIAPTWSPSESYV